MESPSATVRLAGAMARNRDWCSLPAELIDLVSVHLASERDLLHVRQVCTHWRAAVTSRPAAPFRPWVLASRTSPSQLGPTGEYSLWLPRGVRRVELPAVPPGLPYCRGTSRGWLALADDMWFPTRLVLWEPRSGAEIALPPMRVVVQVFLSGDPLGSPSPSGWMAVATHVTESMDNKVFFWRPGDGDWSPAARELPHNFCSIQSVAFHGGKMYCIESMQRIAVYDLRRAAEAAPPPPVLLDARCMTYARAAHFVACNGDLLFVLLPGHRRPSFPDVYNLGPRGPSTTRRRGYRQELDLRKKDMVTDLGGYSLFLGRGDTFALSAAEQPAICRNCIYYVPLEQQGVNRRKWIWAFVFDLESRAVEKIKFPPEHVESNGRNVRWWPCSWFCPQKPVLLKHHR